MNVTVGPVASSFIVLIALGAWLICAGVAAYNYWSAYAKVRPRLPPQFQDSRTAMLALDTLIWDPAIASRCARRRNLLFQLCGSVSIVALAICAWARGQFTGAVIATAIGVYGAGVAYNRWRKYKDLL